MTVSAPAATSLNVTSQSLRVWSMVGRRVTARPEVALGSRNRVMPSSGVLQHVAVALGGSGQRDAARAQVGGGFHPREGRPRLARRELRQPDLLLRFAARL